MAKPVRIDDWVPIRLDRPLRNKVIRLEMHRTLQSQKCILTRSTRDGCLLQTAVGVLIGTTILFAWHRNSAGSFEPNTNNYFFAMFSAFIVFFLVGTLCQYAFPVYYTTTITPDSVVFQRSNRDSPDIKIARDDVLLIYRALPPWYAAKKTTHLYSYAFELTHDRWYIINYRFVYAATRSSFANAIERLWEWPSLSDAPVCHRLMSR